jgi:hypothetical protein
VGDPAGAERTEGAAVSPEMDEGAGKHTEGLTVGNNKEQVDEQLALLLSWAIPGGETMFPAGEWNHIREKEGGPLGAGNGLEDRVQNVSGGEAGRRMQGEGMVSNGGTSSTVGLGVHNGWVNDAVLGGDDHVLNCLLAILPPISPFTTHDNTLIAPPQSDQVAFGDDRSMMGYKYGGFLDVVLPAGDRPGVLEGGEEEMVGSKALGLGIGGPNLLDEHDIDREGMDGRGRKRLNKEVEADVIKNRPGMGREKQVRRGENQGVEEWVVLAEGYLRRGIDNTTWSRCVDLWTELERTALSKNSRLTESALWPIELSKWVSSRKWDSDPVVENLLDFARRWIAWWRAMQPSCWKVEGQDLPADLSDGMTKDMAILKKAGANGIVVLLVGLKWWAPLRVKDRRWEAVVKNIVQCLEMFVG